MNSHGAVNARHLGIFEAVYARHDFYAGLLNFLDARGGVRCGDGLRARMEPSECPLFRKVCTPENPVGPCMVSSEGSCAAYYRYY